MNGLRQFQQHFHPAIPMNSSVSGLSTCLLDRSSLPTTKQYLAERGLLKSGASQQWASICCPAHKGGAETHPSLRVSLADGHFRCMACDAKGGDIVSLHRLFSGLSFREAVRDLGGRFHD